MPNRPFFTREQEDWICYQIGEWYLDWKNKIAPGKNLLGIAKWALIEILCNYPEEDSHEVGKPGQVLKNDGKKFIWVDDERTCQQKLKDNLDEE